MIYILPLFIVGVVFITAGVASIIGICINKEPAWIYGIGYGLFFGIFMIGFALTEPNPTTQNLKEGRAEYQEVYYITGNDTVKEYKLVWKSDAWEKK